MSLEITPETLRRLREAEDEPRKICDILQLSIAEIDMLPSRMRLSKAEKAALAELRAAAVAAAADRDGKRSGASRPRRNDSQEEASLAGARRVGLADDDWFTQLIKDIPAFRSLDERTLTALASQARARRCAPRETIMRQGFPADAVYILSRGRANVSEMSPDGRTVTIRELGPGEIIGEVSLFDGDAPSPTVTALTEVELVELKRASFMTLLGHNPQIAVALLGVLASRLRWLSTWADDRAALPLSARLAKCLLGLLAEDGQPTGPTRFRIRRRISQQALAERLGVTRESINKHLERLGKAGILAKEAGHLVITDRAALEAAAAND